jgi:hypothetical protein
VRLLPAGLLLARSERDVGLGPSPGDPAGAAWPLELVLLAAAIVAVVVALALVRYLRRA